MSLFAYPILAVDTSMNACSVALKTDADEQAYAKSIEMPRGHAEALVPLIQEIANEAGISLTDIQSYVVTRGPGAFAGLRVGLSTVRAMAQASKKPVFGISTLEAMAAQMAPKANGQNLCCIIETKRKDLYTQSFSSQSESMDEAKCLLPVNVAQTYSDALFCGDAVERLANESEQEIDTLQLDNINPSILIEIIEKNSNTDKYNKTDPLYLRPADVSSPKMQITVK